MLAQSVKVNGAGRGRLGGAAFVGFTGFAIVLSFWFCAGSCLIVHDLWQAIRTDADLNKGNIMTFAPILTALPSGLRPARSQA